MLREEYLERLRRALGGRMAAEDVERTVAYYAACLDEAGPEGEEGRMADWGAPEELAEELLDRLGRKKLSPRGKKLLWGAIAGVLVLSGALWLGRLRPWAPQVGESGSSDLTEPFTAVEVDLDWGDITLRQEGDLCRVESDWTGNDYTINAWVEKGVLRVEGRQRGGLHLSADGKQTAQVTITVPEGASLRELEVTTGMGDVSLTGGGDGLAVGPLTVESDLGSVTVEGLTAEECEITADLGDLTLMQVSGAELELTADLGNVTVQDGTFTGGAITCDGGTVDLSGGLSGTWEITNSMGAVTFASTCTGWGYDLEADLGHITLNGADRGTRAEAEGGPNRLTAYSDLGDIVVDLG